MQLRRDVAAGRLSGDPKGYGTRMTDMIAIEDEGEFGIGEALPAASDGGRIRGQLRRGVPHQLKAALARLALNAAE